MHVVQQFPKWPLTIRFINVCRIYMAGLVGFMGNGDLWGFIITHKSEWGFMGIYG